MEGGRDDEATSSKERTLLTLTEEGINFHLLMQQHNQ